MSLFTRLARRRRFQRPGFATDALTFTPEGLAETFDVELVLGGPVDPVSGMIQDVAEVDRRLAGVLDKYERLTNPAPTLERLAEDLYEDLRDRFLPARVEKLRLSRGDDLWVDVWP